MSDPSGTDLFAGRFAIREMLGSGGSAAVFRATDVPHDREVALKVLHAPIAPESPLLERFFDSARRAAAVRDDRVARVLGFGVDDAGTAWIAMPLVEGQTLQDRVSETGRLSVVEAAAVVREVLAALTAVHASGLVHRDVTPGNVMLARRGGGREEDGGGWRATLLDLGLADVTGRPSTVDDGSGRAMVEGSVHYMSPEQAAGLPIDPRADLYQVGALLYFSLTGRPPFPRVDAETTMRAHLTAPPPLASAMAPEVPREIDRVIVRAMMKSPQERPASAAQLSAELLDAARAAPATAPLDGSVASMLAARPPVAAPPRTLVLPATRIVAGDRTVRLPASRQPTASRPTQPAAHRRSPVPALSTIAAALVVSSVVVWVVTAGAADSAPLPVPSSSTPSATAPMPVNTGPAQTAPPVTREDTAKRALVPDLSGMAFDEATAALAAAGLALGAVSTEDGPTARSTVLRTDPASGAKLELGSAVAVFVASGSARVPQVLGMDSSGAISAISAAGFSAIVSGPVDGEIRRTLPAAGELLELGSQITLVMAAKPPAAPTPTPTPSPSAEPAEPETQE